MLPARPQDTPTIHHSYMQYIALLCVGTTVSRTLFLQTGWSCLPQELSFLLLGARDTVVRIGQDAANLATRASALRTLVVMEAYGVCDAYDETASASVLAWLQDTFSPSASGARPADIEAVQVFSWLLLGIWVEKMVAQSSPKQAQLAGKQLAMALTKDMGGLHSLLPQWVAKVQVQGTAANQVRL